MSQLNLDTIAGLASPEPLPAASSLLKILPAGMNLFDEHLQRAQSLSAGQTTADDSTRTDGDRPPAPQVLPADEDRTASADNVKPEQDAVGQGASDSASDGNGSAATAKETDDRAGDRAGKKDAETSPPRRTDDEDPAADADQSLGGAAAATGDSACQNTAGNDELADGAAGPRAQAAVNRSRSARKKQLASAAAKEEPAAEGELPSDLGEGPGSGGPGEKGIDGVRAKQTGKTNLPKPSRSTEPTKSGRQAPAADIPGAPGQQGEQSPEAADPASAGQQPGPIQLQEQAAGAGQQGPVQPRKRGAAAARGVEQAPPQDAESSAAEGPEVDAPTVLRQATDSGEEKKTGTPDGKAAPAADTSPDRQPGAPLRVSQDSGQDPRDASGIQSPGEPRSDQIDRVRFVQRVSRAFEAMGDRNGSVRLRLSPPELGALRLEITVRSGVMSARLEAETPAARNLLLDSLPALRERLAEQNIKVEQFDVDLMNRSAGGLPDQTAGDWQSRQDPAHPTTPQANADVEGTRENAPDPRGLDLSGEGHRLNVII